MRSTSNGVSTKPSHLSHCRLPLSLITQTARLLLGFPRTLCRPLLRSVHLPTYPRPRARVTRVDALRIPSTSLSVALK